MGRGGSGGILRAPKKSITRRGWGERELSLFFPFYPSNANQVVIYYDLFYMITAAQRIEDSIKKDKIFRTIPFPLHWLSSNRPFLRSPPRAPQIPHLLVSPPHYHRYLGELTCGNIIICHGFGQGNSSLFLFGSLCNMLYLSNSTEIYDTNNETAMMPTPAAQDFDKHKIPFCCVNPWIDRAPIWLPKANWVGDPD